MFSILKRGKASVLFKFPEKISKIVKATVQTDIHNRGIRSLEKNDCLLDPVFINISNRRFAQDFFEKTAEILFIHTGISRKIPDIDFLLIMFADELKRRFYDLNSVVIRLFRLGKKGKRGKKSQHF